MDPGQFIAFQHPFTCLVGGPSGCGKTFLVRNILKNNNVLIDNVDGVLWCFGVYQSIYNNHIDNVRVTYFKGLPSTGIIKKYTPNVIVIDDLMIESEKNEDIVNLFTKGSHHNNITVIMLLQKVFFKSPSMRTISLNAHYLIIMKNPRDKSQIRFLAQQLLPANIKRLIEAYNDATKLPFSYIKIYCTLNSRQV